VLVREHVQQRDGGFGLDQGLQIGGGEGLHDGAWC